MVTCADYIEVHCSHSEIVNIHNLRQHPRNPNQHPDNQIRILSEIISEQGWRVPITVSNLSGYIVRGHGRYMAACNLGVQEVPVDYQDYEDELDEMADLVADNKIQELSTLDPKKLNEIIERLDGEIHNMELTGFSMDRLEEMVMSSESPSDGEWGETSGKNEDFIPFRFGFISGLVSKSIYDAFKESVEQRRIRKGVKELSLADAIGGFTDA